MTWEALWLGVFVVGLGIFSLLVIVVGFRGYKELRDLLK